MTAINILALLNVAHLGLKQISSATYETVSDRWKAGKYSRFTLKYSTTQNQIYW